MCQSSTTHKLYVCSGSPLTWKEPGYWAPQTTNPNNIYNTNTGNVGIGLGSSTAPTQRLDVNGNINVRSSQVRMYNSANHYYGDGSNLAARMSGNFYVQNQAGSGYRYIYAADLYLAAPIYGVARWASQPPSSCIRKFFSSSSGTQTCPAGYNIPMAPLNPVQTSGVFLCCAYT
ncbi:MAG TPA: hypothetical protein DCL35_02535 [Candidatus Omnitrophica bacterium]|nr:hypothetical protein [Candidatus Omnitrophota bacterium]